MIINHRRRWILITPPKTGSTTLRKLLVDQASAEGACSFTGHQHDTAVPDDCQDYTLFATVRNPFDRAVSLWRHRLWDLSNQQASREGGRPHILLKDMARQHPFSQFVPWMATAQAFYAWPCARWLQFVRVDGLLRLESLRDDLQRWDLLPTGSSLPHENRTGHGPVHLYYTAETRDFIRTLHSRDFEAFGYSDELR